MRKAINGTVYGWGSLRIILGSLVLPGLQEINYNDLLDSKWVYGQGQHFGPIALTPGKYIAQPTKFKILVSDADQLREALAAQSPSGISYGQVPFQIHVQGRMMGYRDRDDKLCNCSYRETSDAFKNENEELVEEITCNTQWIERNGLVVFDASQGMPDGGLSVAGVGVGIGIGL